MSGVAEHMTALPARSDIHAKLTVGPVNDPLEREADEIAELVLGTSDLRHPIPEPAAGTASTSDARMAATVQRCPGGCPTDDELGTALLQRRASVPPVDEALHRTPFRGGDRSARRHCTGCAGHEQRDPGISTDIAAGPVARTRSAAPSVIAAGVAAMRNRWQPLSGAERAFFEPRFGRSFEDVRIHTDERADVAARAISARAFTYGTDIAFALGQYRPGTHRGRRLLAHELAHVVQQRGHGASPAGGGTRHEASAQLTLHRQTDVDIDIDEVDRERVPAHEGTKIAEWGLPHVLLGGITDLVTHERLPERFHTVDAAIAASLQRHVAVAVMEEYGGFYTYLITYETLLERFNTTNTLVHFTDTPGQQSSANVVAIDPDLKALITEDEGILTPAHGVGVLMDHSKNFGDYKSDVESAVENSLAFLTGLQAGLPNLQQKKLAKMLALSGSLNSVFPVPFAVGTVEGLANELRDVISLLDVRQWPALLEAASNAAKFLTDPNGSAAAEALGVDVGKAMAADVNDAMDRGVIYFSYAMGKLIGPTVAEVILALVGIEIGLLGIAGKAARLSRASIDVLTDSLKASRLIDDIDLSPLSHAVKESGPIGPSAGKGPINHPAVGLSERLDLGAELGVHTLSIVEEGGELILRLCSDACGALIRKIQAAIRRAESRGTPIDAYQAVLEEAESVQPHLSFLAPDEADKILESLKKRFAAAHQQSPEITRDVVGVAPGPSAAGRMVPFKIADPQAVWNDISSLVRDVFPDSGGFEIVGEPEPFGIVDKASIREVFEAIKENPDDWESLHYNVRFHDGAEEVISVFRKTPLVGPTEFRGPH